VFVNGERVYVGLTEQSGSVSGFPEYRSPAEFAFNIQKFGIVGFIRVSLGFLHYLGKGRQFVRIYIRIVHKGILLVGSPRGAPPGRRPGCRSAAGRLGAKLPGPYKIQYIFIIRTILPQGNGKFALFAI
jgi:hypothetical protein